MNDASRPSQAPVSRASERLYTELRDQIMKGRLRKGERLEPLRALAKRYDATMRGVRTVMMRLQEQGLVRMRQGSGVYVSWDADAEPTQGTVRPSIVPKRRNHTRVVMMLDHLGEVWGDLSYRLITRLMPQGLRPLPMTCVGNEPTFAALQLEHCIEEWREDPPYALVLQHEQASALVEQIEDACHGRSHLIRIGTNRPGWHTARIDYQKLGEIAVDHLLDRGHTRIGLMLAARSIDEAHPENQHKSTAVHTPYILGMGKALRRRGIRDGLTIHYNMLADTSDPRSTSPTEPDSERRLVAWLRQDNRPTAFVSSDHYLACLTHTAAGLGLEPGRDFDRLGLGNTDWSRIGGFDTFDLQVAEYVTGIEKMLKSPVPPFGPEIDLAVVPRLITRAEHRP